MKLNWNHTYPVEGFDNAFDHGEIPWPCKVLDADGNECLVRKDEVQSNKAGNERPNGMVLVPGKLMDTETGEVWWNSPLPDTDGWPKIVSKIFKAPLQLVPFAQGDEK